MAPNPKLRPNLTAVRDALDARVLIIGTGFSGLGMAINLKEAGIEDFIVLEKADDVGGTWRENTYPGAACDVPSHLYCYSFEPKSDWSRVFAPQPEILAYLRHCATKFDVRRHVRFGVSVSAARYHEEGAFWEVTTEDGAKLRAQFLVCGKGALHVPSFPEIKGLESFTGPKFHSAEWDASVDLTGKRVAIIGSGASAIQIVPAIASKVKALHYYQRTAPWVLPRHDRDYTHEEKDRFARSPLAAYLHRQKIYWSMEPRVLGFAVAPKIMTVAQQMGVRNIARHIKDPVLRDKLTPKFTMGCKRTLISDDYYAALTRKNVDVITDRIVEVTPNAVVTADGVSRDVDVIVYCTGFRVTDVLSGLEVYGRGGRSLDDEWKSGAEAYLGINTSGYPNLFFLMGPNTGLGHNSMVYMIEAQIHYTLETIRAVEKAGKRSAEVKPEAQKRFIDSMQARLGKTVWASGCQSWYLDEKGRNTTTWPGFTFEYRARTFRFPKRDYVLA